MEFQETSIPDLKLVKLRVHGDARGFFVERYREDLFARAGITEHFTQDNHSRSGPGVLRGLHYQVDPPQGKLVGCVHGRIWDVAVDVRAGSPSYGQHYGVELSAESGLLLWVPAGFAHGFCVLGNEPADLLYKVTGTYNAATEGGIRWNDPDLNIPWPLSEPLVSDRDQKLSRFSDYRKAPAFRHA